MQRYPKVLIIGQTFNNYTGGGITLSNLFYGWPKDRLSVFASNKIFIVPNELCDNSYGHNRYKWPLFLALNNKIGISTCNYVSIPTNRYASRFSFLNKFGIIPIMHSSHIDTTAVSWIQEFNPDIIYSQLADYSLMKIVYKVKMLTRKPLILHFMDDWPNDIYSGSFLNKYFRKKTITLLKKLINISSGVLCICEKMAQEYSIRYQRNCDFIYNSPIIKKNVNFSKTDILKKKNIGYFGRIGKGSYQSIINLVKAIINHPNIKLTIHSLDYQVLECYKDYVNVSINPPLQRETFMEIFNSVDLLYLPIDHDEAAIKFLKLSFSTKTFEYLSSGVPVLLNAPRDIALTEFFIENKCGFVINNATPVNIESFVIDFYNGAFDINSVLRNAIYAFDNYANFEKNREKFLSIMGAVSW